MKSAIRLIMSGERGHRRGQLRVVLRQAFEQRRNDVELPAACRFRGIEALDFAAQHVHESDASCGEHGAAEVGAIGTGAGEPARLGQARAMSGGRSCRPPVCIDPRVFEWPGVKRAAAPTMNVGLLQVRPGIKVYRYDRHGGQQVSFA